MRSQASISALSSALLLGGTTAQAQPASRQADPRPNIILILADDMGRECIGCYGSTYQTPNIDRLAEDGLRFTHCFSQPLSTPSRVQLMTGKYNHKNYVEFGYLNPDQKTFAHPAKEAGYATAIAGKWQLGFNSKLPELFGFDRNCLWQLSYARADGERYANPLIEKDGVVLETTDDDYGPDIFTGYLLEFINENRRHPFLIYYPMALVHDPFWATPDSESWRSGSAARRRCNAKHFKNMVSYADKVVGKIVEKLKLEGLYENTLIIFTGDNGTGRQIATPMRDGTTVKGGKGQTLDRGVRVPLVVRWGARQYQSHVVDDLVDFSDFFPTMADAMHAPIPDSWGIDGQSFLPQLVGEKGNPRKWVFSHYNPLLNLVANYFSARSFRDHRYRFYHDGRLYDLWSDPEETSPIGEGKGSQEAEEVRKVFQKEMSKLPPWRPGDKGSPKIVLPGYEPGATKMLPVPNGKKRK